MPAPGVKVRIDRFWRAVRRLKELSDVSKESFIKNDDKIDATERNLQVSIEAMIDVGEFLISYMKWETPKSYREIGEILNKHNVFDNEMRDKFVDLVRIRNIIVHNYVYLSPEDIYSYSKRVINSLTSLMKRILTFMVNNNIDP